MTFIQMGLGLKLGDVRESRETGERRIPNGDKLSLYIPEYILRKFADLAYFVRSYMK